MKREEFIQQTGGIDENGNILDQHQKNITIYAEIEVEELLRKQKYPIQNIIPKSFLKDYLNSKKCSFKN